LVFDGTLQFCSRFLKHDRRTTDQMVQAARSGKQNIVEGSEASGVSKETEIKLTKVAYASLGELLEDYRDYIRNHKAVLWDKNSREALYVRNLAVRAPDGSRLREFFETKPDTAVANIIVCLIHQTRYLINQQVAALEKAFVKEGGIRERMTRARLEYRKQHPDKR